MNIFASLVVVAAFAFPFISQAQTRPAAPPRPVDYNQAKKTIIDQQSQTLTMMENFKRCQTPARDAATKTKCDADVQVFMKWLDQQIDFTRIQLRCTNTSSSVDAMKECMKRELTARPNITAGAPSASKAPATSTAPAARQQPARK